MKTSGLWFITDGRLVLAQDHAGYEQLKPVTKRGLAPSNSYAFRTRSEAETELSVLVGRGVWPLFTPSAFVASEPLKVKS